MVADYFTEDELIKKTGIAKDSWDFVILKELIDNALDAIEPLQKKSISVNYLVKDDQNILQIFDNGTGISLDTIQQIYDFSVYISRNRHFVTPSRGKQGNGLKTIISICYLLGYKLRWHTSDGVIIENMVDASEVEKGIVDYKTVNAGFTSYRGIEIVGYKNLKNKCYVDTIEKYSTCNPDVEFVFNLRGIVKKYQESVGVVNKAESMSIAFYDYHTFVRMIRDTQDGNKTYKAFLGEYFGTRIKNASEIKGKIKDIIFSSTEFKEDFARLKLYQNNKQYTVLKKHMIGLKYSLNTEMLVQKTKCDEADMYVPCIVEYDVEKTDLKNDKRYWADCQCFINNTITYKNSFSIVFDEAYYEIGTRKCNSSRDLADLLLQYNDYKFTFHFISPYFVFRDAGKTEIDISCIIKNLCKDLKRAIAKEKKKYDALVEKPPQNTDILRLFMDEAFNLASTYGKYAITARQMWYKIRELSNISDEAYSSFTQIVLTEWINNHPQYEDKINFANRGVFYIGNKQDGLGTANVRNFINNLGTSSDKFKCYGGVSSDVYIEDDFNLQYKYDKALYIEKTGFDDIFKVEGISEKYHMIIVSGQGFATRAAKTILYALQKKGLKLYCMHDLDISGLNIYKSFQNPNDKFEHSIVIEDLGITIEDVKKYHIMPERVTKKEEDKNKLASLSEKYREFFDGGTYFNRVELNAFTTEQILEIMDEKLSKVNKLPTVNLKETFEIDHQAIKEVAFMRVMSRKYKDSLADIFVPCDLSMYDDRCTVDVAKKAIPKIEDELISKYEQEIDKKLNIS